MKLDKVTEIVVAIAAIALGIVLIAAAMFVHGLKFVAIGLAFAVLFGTNVNLWTFFWAGAVFSLVAATISTAIKRKKSGAAK